MIRAVSTHFILALLFAGATLHPRGTAHADSQLMPLSSFPKAQLSIRTAAGTVHQFKIWIANDEAHREQGLMFVKSLDEHAGMLFTYPYDQPVAMWMKNTLIPLDMLFIAHDGRVAHISTNAVPQSLDTIAAPYAVRGVLELSGGAAERLGIHEGDLLSSAALKLSPSP